MTNRDRPGDDATAAALIRMPNKIKDKVTLGGRIKGDGFDPKLLQRAERRVEAMRDVFLDAARDDIDRLVAALSNAQTDAARRGRHLDTLEKIAHEIKGYGSHIGYDLLTRFADSLSLFLRKAKTTVAVKLEVAEVHVDAMRLVYHDGLTGDGGEQGADLTAGLRSAVGRYLRAEDF